MNAEKVIGNDFDPFAHNKKLSNLLSLISNYYTIAGDIQRARSFGNASVAVANYPYTILSGSEAQRNIRGIGESISVVIDEFLRTGTSQRLIDLQTKYVDQTAIINEFRSYYGIGPATAFKLYNKGLRTIEDVWKYDQEHHELTDAQKTGIIWHQHLLLRIPRDEMNLIRNKISSILDKYGIKWQIAGSYRRQEPSSGDVDVLVESQPTFNMAGLISLMKDILPATLAQGETKFMGIIRIDNNHNGHRIDIRLINPESYPFALMYFTGSQRFNILMRQRAIDLGLTLNEYGLFKSNQLENTIIVKSEEDIFQILLVRYLDPSERTKTMITLPIIQ